MDAWDINHLTDFDTSAERGGKIVSDWCKAVGMGVEPGVAMLVVADVFAWVALLNDERIGGMIRISPEAVASAARSRFVYMRELKGK